MSFLGFWDEPVDRLVSRKVVRLDVVASNLEQRGTDRPVGLSDETVNRLDAVAVNYCTNGKRSTGSKWLTDWVKTVDLLVDRFSEQCLSRPILRLV